MNQNTNNTLTQKELIDKCFTYWNALKRHRALADIKKNEGNRDAYNFHLMKMYQMGDQLELSLRALQRGQRQIDEGEDVDGEHEENS